MVKISGWGSTVSRILVNTLLVSLIGCVTCFTFKIQMSSPCVRQGILNIVGDDLKQKEMGDNLQEIIKNVKNTTEKADKILGSINNILGDKKDQEKIKENLIGITENTNECLSSLNSILKDKDNLSQIIENAAGITSGIKKAVDAFNKGVEAAGGIGIWEGIRFNY